MESIPAQFGTGKSFRLKRNLVVNVFVLSGFHCILMLTLVAKPIASVCNDKFIGGTKVQ